MAAGGGAAGSGSAGLGDGDLTRLLTSQQQQLQEAFEE